MNRRSRAPATMLRTVPGGMPDFPASCIKSAQRELNPHFRHGKAAGCRYIMGALECAGLSKNKSTSGIRGARTPTCRIKSPVCCRYRKSVV